jgi:voltage-gated potassium channel
MSNRVDDNDQTDIKRDTNDGGAKRIQYKNHIKKSQDINKFELIVAALTILSLIIILVVYLEQLTPVQLQILYLFDLCVTIILGIDYTFRLRRRPKGQRLKFIIKNWYEIPAMIPLVVYASFDTHVAIVVVLRALRLITFFRLVRLFRILSYFGDSQLLYIAFFISITTVSGAISIYLVESEAADSDIKTLKDAFWWSVGIVSTIAPNNLVPVTTEGQIIASILMFVSIGVIAILISTLGSKLVQSRLQESKSIQSGETMFIRESKDDIKRKIDKIEDLNSQELDLLLNIIVSTHNTLHVQQQQAHIQKVNSSKTDRNTSQGGLQDKKKSEEENQNKQSENRNC